MDTLSPMIRTFFKVAFIGALGPGLQGAFETDTFAPRAASRHM